MNVKIRKATHDDIDAMVELHAKLYEDNFQYDKHLDMDRPRSKAAMEWAKKAIDENFGLIAEADGKIVGYLHGKKTKYSFKTITHGEISDMCVDPDYRSQGVGTKLVDEFKFWCKENDIKYMLVDLYSSNEKGVRFYERQGFKTAGLVMEAEI